MQKEYRKLVQIVDPREKERIYMKMLLMPEIPQWCRPCQQRYLAWYDVERTLFALKKRGEEEISLYIFQLRQLMHPSREVDALNLILRKRPFKAALNISLDQLLSRSEKIRESNPQFQPHAELNNLRCELVASARKNFIHYNTEPSFFL